MSEETCPDCGLPRWTDSGSKQEFGTCMAHLDQTEPEEIIACRDRELARLRPTPERFYRWWSTLTQEQRIHCWYDLDAMAHPEVVSALKAKLSAATARASELEKQATVERDCRLANELQLYRADEAMGELRERVARAERENEAWRELFWHSYKSGQPLDCHNYREQLCVAVESANERETWRGVGVTPAEAALALAQQLGLLQPEAPAVRQGNPEASE